MRRLLSISFLALLLLVGAAGMHAPVAHADSASASNAAAQTAITKPLDTGGIMSTVMIFIMKLFAWLLGVAVLVLNTVAYYTVVDMGTYIKGLTAIGTTWRILRDIGNILLIFGFLIAGIAVILDTDLFSWNQKMLPSLLVAAVFINFSLFATEAVIDVGNLFATQFYTQINGNVVPTKPNFDASKTLDAIHNEPISNLLMSRLGFATIYGNALSDSPVLQGGSATLIGFMSIILFIVAAFVIFSLAFILVARFITLIFVIILSPIGFAGYAVPKLQGISKQWLDKLVDQTITAPLLFLLLYIALAIITDVHFLVGSPTGWDAFVPNGSGTTGFTAFAGMMLSFILAMGLLLAVVVAAKKLGAAGAAGATKLAGKITFGAVGAVGRRTVGRTSNYAARKIRSSEFGRSETGRLFAGMADRGAKASFDIRGTSALKSFPIGGGVDAGAAQKGGYRGREEELVKARTEYAKTLRQSGGQKKAAEEAVAAKKNEETEHEKNMTPLQFEEQAQLKVMREVVDASRKELKLKQQEVEMAHKSGNADQRRDADLDYNNKLRAHEELKNAESEKLDPIREKIKAEKDRHTDVVAAQDIIIKNNNAAAGQRKYGESLQKKSFLKIPFGRTPYDWSTAVGSARREAAGKIISESKKDENQKSLDRFEAILGKAEKKTDLGGEKKEPEAGKSKE